MRPEWNNKPGNGVDKGNRDGFTLIELAIVLVVIGLIVGGVLVGRSLIAAAAVRAQISQIEKYNAAVSVFRNKYDYLPGDIVSSAAAQFGFAPRGTSVGEGDGNGIIQGVNYYVANPGAYVSTGEAGMFWVDLSTAKLIEGGFNTASSTAFLGGNIPVTGVINYMPDAKIGQGNYVFVFSGAPSQGGGVSTINRNYFCLVGMNGINIGGVPLSYPALTVQEAYSIDTKMDDGMPLTGNVIAFYYGSYANQQNTNFPEDYYPTGVTGVGASGIAQTPGSSTTCFDDNNSTSNPMAYSIGQSNGAGVNCALSFRFQ